MSSHPHNHTASVAVPPSASERVEWHFPNRRVFITGGANGIGRALVEAFCRAGCRVAFCDTDRESGDRLSAATGSRFFALDVCDAEALTSCLQTLFAAWGDLDVLVNNVGISLFTPIEETTVSDFDRILSTNLRPVFITSRALALHRRGLPQRNPYGGRIINITSTRGTMSEPGSEGYAASKGGMRSLTHALAVSLSRYGITVNSVSPGWIEHADYAGLRPVDHAQHPSGRVGRPADIAHVCLFLCMESNGFIDGEEITVDGGMTRKMIYQE